MNFSKYYYMLTLIISFNAFGMQVATQFVEQEQAQIITDMSDERLKISNGKLDCFVKGPTFPVTLTASEATFGAPIEAASLELVF